MAITTRDGYTAAAAGAQPIGICKTASRTSVAAIPFSVFDIAGNPGAGTLAGTSTAAGVVPTDATAGCPTIAAFAGSNIGEVYQRLGIKSAVYTGVSTNNCVDTTAREAADRGYGSILVADATGTCSDRMQDVTLESFRRLWGRVLSTDEVIAELQAAAAAARAA